MSRAPDTMRVGITAARAHTMIVTAMQARQFTCSRCLRETHASAEYARTRCVRHHGSRGIADLSLDEHVFVILYRAALRIAALRLELTASRIDLTALRTDL